MHSHTRFLVGVTHKISYNLDSIRSPKHLKHWAPVCLSSVDRSPFGRPVIHNFCYTRPIRSTDYPDLFGRPFRLLFLVKIRPFDLSFYTTVVYTFFLYTPPNTFEPVEQNTIFGRPFNSWKTPCYRSTQVCPTDQDFSLPNPVVRSTGTCSVDRWIKELNWFGRPVRMFGQPIL